MVHREAPEEILTVNPYKLPADQQGWRGLTVTGVGKRKWWTLLHTDQLLVTGLFLMPGERSVRHSHETGELSIHYDGVMNPGIHWNPPGVIHAGPPTVARDEDDLEKLVNEAVKSMTGNKELGGVLLRILERQQQIKEQLRAMAAPEPAPRIIIDVLLPPFRTTIDDPEYPEKRVVTGQWYD